MLTLTVTSSPESCLSAQLGATIITWRPAPVSNLGALLQLYILTENFYRDRGAAGAVGLLALCAVLRSLQVQVITAGAQTVKIPADKIIYNV